MKILERVEQTSAEEEEAPAGEADTLRLSKRAMDIPADEADPNTAHFMRPGRIKRGGRPLDRPMLMREVLRESDDTDTWQRARITGDLEIHYRPTGNSTFLRNIMRLISAARRIFRK